MPDINDELFTAISSGSMSLMATVRETIQSSEVKTIKLRGKGVDPTHIKHLRFVFQGTEVRTLDLSYNDFGDIGAKAVATSLEGTEVQTLNLMGNKIGAMGVQALADKLRGSDVMCVHLGFTARTLSTVLEENSKLYRKKLGYQRGWAMTGSVLAGHSIFLNDESCILRKLYEKQMRVTC